MGRKKKCEVKGEERKQESYKPLYICVEPDTSHLTHSHTPTAADPESDGLIYVTGGFTDFIF